MKSTEASRDLKERVSKYLFRKRVALTTVDINRNKRLGIACEILEIMNQHKIAVSHHAIYPLMRALLLDPPYLNNVDGDQDQQDGQVQIRVECAEDLHMFFSQFPHSLEWNGFALCEAIVASVRAHRADLVDDLFVYALDSGMPIKYAALEQVVVYYYRLGLINDLARVSDIVRALRLNKHIPLGIAVTEIGMAANLRLNRYEEVVMLFEDFSSLDGERRRVLQRRFMLKTVLTAYTHLGRGDEATAIQALLHQNHSTLLDESGSIEGEKTKDDIRLDEVGQDESELVDNSNSDMVGEQERLSLHRFTMSTEDELLPAPTEALAAFEPFVRWLLSASPDDLSCLPEELSSCFEDEIEESDMDNTERFDSTQKAERPPFENSCKARFALAEAEGKLEAAWDQLSCARREWGTLDEKLLRLQDESVENRQHIALLERRIIKLLQDRDLAIAETYTTEMQIQDAEFFKARQQQRRQQQEEEQRKARVASALRKLLLRRSSNESGNSSGNESPAAFATPKYTEKDVQRLHKELADSKVSAAVAKAERDERRHALRRAERRCVELKLQLAQARAEEDDLQVSLQQLTRARRSSVGHLQQISLFSAAALPLQPPPAPTAGLRASTS
ncbi:Hypothetical protein PHPALM_15729 [Phytophthora palmivora]|uniref:Uncharacterized protein n=1 Tax=Phytophthora palmivora TaxID=4796 RepID=A0A2P4XRG1_9STRA|nr:Hypothetical protein PHPALM_15729 [Phytophthora palmivora]